VTFTFDL